MKLEKDFKNEVLKRQEISFVIEDKKNPDFDKMRKKIAEELSKPEENIEVYNIKGSFGSNEFKIYAYIYDSKEELEKALNRKKSKKQKEVDAKAKEDAEKAKKEDESKAEEGTKKESEASEKNKSEEEKSPEIPAE